MSEKKTPYIEISSSKFLAACAVISAVCFLIGLSRPFPPWMIAVEVFITIISLFIFGSIHYRIDKNALTYGAVLIIVSTFWGRWWPHSHLHQIIQARDHKAVWDFMYHNFFTLHGLDQLVHADTMLFILGLTLFVSVIAQTRLLETFSFAVLKKSKGLVVPTIAILTAIVSFSSGILDGVSMIGLMIRTMVIILFLAKSDDGTVIYAVMVSTIVTTVCGMWLAYGEPPNLIMKANLYPYLDNLFFLRYCLPVAVGSYCIVYWNLRKKLQGEKIEMKKLDILDSQTADVRFLQASRHEDVLTPIEFIQEHKDLVQDHFEPIMKRLHHSESLGIALVKESVPENVRIELLGKFVAEDLAEALNDHYNRVENEHHAIQDESEKKIQAIFESMSHLRVKSQKIGGLSFVPFIGFLIWHAMDHTVPLFLASFAGFAIALVGIFPISKMRRLALREAKHEYTEYVFLFPLFLSITLLQKTGFFNQLSTLLTYGIEKIGGSHLAYAQFIGAAFLSAILDNNVVADFASRALHGLDIGTLHLFSMAQIAGYAVGGCWTHIGSAQSVVAYAFIRKEIDQHFTPLRWIKSMTPIILEIFLLMTLVVYLEGWILSRF